MQAVQYTEQNVVKSLSPQIDFMWLEITGRCNLECVHCYADSSPQGTHGRMTYSDWCRVIDEAFSLGCKRVEFIGGEPTLHPDFEALVRKAHSLSLEIEVFSNFLNVPHRLWQLFDDCQVDLATSFYSAVPEIHDLVTARQGSQRRTLNNIREATQRGRTVRIGVVQMMPEQDLVSTTSLLESVGVNKVDVDSLREVGRGEYKKPQSIENLCGRCSGPLAAINPDGEVFPCVFSRWLPIGNVLEASLAGIMNGNVRKDVRAQLENNFSSRQKSCSPSICSPNNCTPSHIPCQPISNPGRTMLNTLRACSPENCTPTHIPCQPISNPHTSMFEAASVLD